MEEELKKVIESGEQKNKKKRLYSQICHLKKTLASPDNKIIDPEPIKEKKEKDRVRRVGKKIEKGKLAKEERDHIKKSDKKCLGCKAYGHVLAHCPVNEQLTHHPLPADAEQ